MKILKKNKFIRIKIKTINYKRTKFKENSFSLFCEIILKVQKIDTEFKITMHLIENHGSIHEITITVFRFLLIDLYIYLLSFSKNVC